MIKRTLGLVLSGLGLIMIIRAIIKLPFNSAQDAGVLALIAGTLTAVGIIFLFDKEK